MSQETDNQEARFELAHIGNLTALVVRINDGCIEAVHPTPISIQAAEWLLEDLRDDSSIPLGAVDLGELYAKGCAILGLLDYRQPAKVNARIIAMAELKTAADVEAYRRNADSSTDIPF